MSDPVFWENKKNIISLSSAEFAKRVVKVKRRMQVNIFFLFLDENIGCGYSLEKMQLRRF